MNNLHPLIRFIIIGVVNTINYYVMYIILLQFLTYMSSHILSFLWAFLCSYLLNCYVVYQVKPKWRTFLQFPLTQIINMGLQTALLYLFIRLFHWSAALAPFPSLLITIPVTYVISKRILEEKP